MIGSIKNHEVNAGKPLKFIEASMFQWVNPKAWTIAITVSTAFYPSEENYIFAFLFLAFFASLINLPCISLWALFGASLRKFIDNDKIKKTIEYFFALLLVLTGIYLAIN
jgi:threonine/homoserine/homoserine lactone efflux protein